MSSYNSKYYNGLSPTLRPAVKTSYQTYDNPYENRSYNSEIESHKSGGYYSSKANIITTTNAPSFSYKPIEYYSNPYDLNITEPQEKAKRSAVTYERVQPQMTQSLLYETKPIRYYGEKPQTSYYDEIPQKTYRYEEKTQTYQPQKPYQYEEKAFIEQKSNVIPYDYRSYNPLDARPMVFSEKERLSETPYYVEKPKKVHFYEYKVPEYEVSNKISSQLDEMKYKLGEIQDQISRSPQLHDRASISRPKIFEYQKIYDVKTPDLRQTSPLYHEKAEFIKRSGVKTSSKSPSRSPTKSPAESPLRKSFTHKSRIFSPLTISRPPLDTNLFLKNLESPKIQKSFRSELPKKNLYESPKYENYDKTGSKDVVVPSQIPLHYVQTERMVENKPNIYENRFQTGVYYENKPKVYESNHFTSGNYDLKLEKNQYFVEEKPKMTYYSYPAIEKNQNFIENSRTKIIENPKNIQSISLQRRGTDNFENILCIDCQQYIKVTNANLHSLFCFKNIEIKGENKAKNDIRSRLRNIIYFLSDEIARIKKKENFVDGVFWDNCEELKKCLSDIVECKREIEVHSLINRLHYVNSLFDQTASPHAQEIKKLGMKAEDDLMS